MKILGPKSEFGKSMHIPISNPIPETPNTLCWEMNDKKLFVNTEKKCFCDKKIRVNAVFKNILSIRHADAEMLSIFAKPLKIKENNYPQKRRFSLRFV